ncbi:hypothetical protein PENARI_c039G01478 [Penicillium arizonense]|uniref:Uncharacterized protein n=1 Tax=Penicillium arizonense TaxID=1835702 RepID=A0A1F5L370_PENAI|nr:hypothetical protein PENARI_c039G01478 [Penicillium arizonense]OGE47664.1 hypothetical protein PENARI_c039G01478 [Penicillium arizonense]
MDTSAIDYDASSTLHLNREQSNSQQMDSLRLTLLSALANSKSYQKVLQGGHNLARFMNIPLMSDILAEKISYLFSEVCPHIRDSEDKDSENCISWVDVVREDPFEVEQHNEKYRFRLSDRQGVFEMTQFDYDFILSGLPRKLINPQTHTGDILAEISAIDLLTSEMKAWRGVAAEISETIDDTLHRLSERLIKLEDLDVPEFLFQEPLVAFPGANVESALPCGRRWTAEEKDILPLWFESKAALPVKDIESQFEQDFGHRRSIGAIQAMLNRKKRKS